jgi:hypothetical protein
MVRKMTAMIEERGQDNRDKMPGIRQQRQDIHDRIART